MNTSVTVEELKDIARSMRIDVIEMLYKSDWDKTKERFTAWWEQEDIDRCALAVTAPRSGLLYEQPPASL